jgi:holliday junction DNA helicase RuvB
VWYADTDEEIRLRTLAQFERQWEKEDKELDMELWSPRGMVSTTPEDIFAPKTFSDYVGQDDAKSLAQIMIQAAQMEHRPLPNIMIVGEYGLGKTSLAQIIMREYGEPVKLVDGASVNAALPSGHVIIDEIHNLANDVADSLNIQIDQNKVHIVGCTTNPGSLPSAFRSRFRLLQLDSYDVVNLTEILRRVTERKQVSATRDILSQIALRSRFNARYALSNLALVFDLITIRNQTTITKPIIMEAFTKLGVDAKGYLRRDYKFMAALPDDRAVGLQYLSAITGIDGKTIEEEVEPYLLRMGLLDRTSRGRLKLREIQ